MVQLTCFFLSLMMVLCQLPEAFAKGGEIRPDTCMQKQIPHLLKRALQARAREQPLVLLQGLYQLCPGMPVGLRALLSLHTRLPSHLRSQIWSGPTRQVLRLQPNYWRGACPGFPLKSFGQLDSLAPFTHAQHIHKHCKGVGATLLTKAEAKRSDMYLFVGGAAFYVGLVASGISAKHAREYTRRGFMMRYIHRKWSLQPSLTQTSFRPRTELELLQDTVLVNTAKVCGVQKGKIAALHRDKRTPSLIRPIHQKLLEAANRIRTMSRFNRTIKFRGRLALFVRPEIRYQLLQDVLYTSKMAGFRRVSFVTQNLSMPSTLLTILPIRTAKYRPGVPVPAVVKGLAVLVRWKTRGISIRVNKQEVGPGCQKRGLVSRMKGQVAIPFGQHFKRRLRSCMSRFKGWYPKVKSALLVPMPWSDFRSVVAGLDAVSYAKHGRYRFSSVYLTLQLR